MNIHSEESKTLYGEILGRKIRELRRQRGISQYEMAQRMWGRRTCRPLISRVESGQSDIQFSTLVRICAVLGITIAQLLQEFEKELYDAHKIQV